MISNLLECQEVVSEKKSNAVYEKIVENTSEKQAATSDLDYSFKPGWYYIYQKEVLEELPTSLEYYKSNPSTKENSYNCNDSTCQAKKHFCLPIIGTLLGAWGDGRSFQDGYTGGEVFAAAYNLGARCYPFIDAQFLRMSDTGNFASNVGCGFRTFSPHFTEMVGVNAFFDYRRLVKQDLYQLGIGAEFIGRCWDLRCNGYIPVGQKRCVLTRETINYSPGFTAVREDDFFSMWGLDVEIGHHFICNCCIDLYAALGPYFYNSVCCQSIIGGAGRVVATCNRYLSLQLYATHDALFGTKFLGELRISFSFPSLCSGNRCRSLYRRVYRNPIIVTEKIDCWESNF